jgi:hypothetical protein
VDSQTKIERIEIKRLIDRRSIGRRVLEEMIVKKGKKEQYIDGEDRMEIEWR